MSTNVNNKANNSKQPSAPRNKAQYAGKKQNNTKATGKYKPKQPQQQKPAAISKKIVSKQEKRQRQTENLLQKIVKMYYANASPASPNAAELFAIVPKQLLPLVACLVANYNLVTDSDLIVSQLLWNDPRWLRLLEEIFDMPTPGPVNKKFFTYSRKTIARIRRMIKIADRDQLTQNGADLREFLNALGESETKTNKL